MNYSTMDSRGLEHSATRILACAAFQAGAIEDTDFDFVVGNPHRVEEVLEFTRWLAEAALPCGSGCGCPDCSAPPDFTEPCPRCGSEETEQSDPVPSMAGYGHDSSLTCCACGHVAHSVPAGVM